MHTQFLREYTYHASHGSRWVHACSEENKQLCSNPKPPQLSLHASNHYPLWTHTVLNKFYHTVTHSRKEGTHTASKWTKGTHTIEQYQLRASSRPKEKIQCHTCVHVGLQWYKIHVKYNNNICRINTLRILHIQHTLERCHMNNKSWGRKDLNFHLTSADMSY